ncbi:hypothetical protein [Cryptosporangium sp. NPDC051539]|uniref:hypothetical protein n=1 Tax=Cryptosporangium sp. NPDC051539 TaxID=3363962 RepID=UPI0037BB4831
MPATANRVVITRRLTELAGERHRVADALFAMDTSDSGLAFLRTASLEGATLALWERLRPRIDTLWGVFRAFGGALDAAGPPDSRPGRAQLGEISALLGAPLADDSLPASLRPVPVARIGQWLEEECRQVSAALAQVGTRLSAVASLTDLEARLDDPEHPAGAALRALRARAATDPIGTDPGAPGAVAVIAAAEAEADRRQRLAVLRAGYPARVAALGQALERLAEAEAAVGDANARATATIRDPRLPADTPRIGALRHRLAALDRLDGAALDQALPALEQAVTAAHTAAVDRRAFADGLYERRDELRGRLEAYLMKAVRSGVGEREDVLSAYDTARALLWSAPCDLPAATRAVVAYQRSLLTSPGGGTE